MQENPKATLNLCEAQQEGECVNLDPEVVLKQSIPSLQFTMDCDVGLTCTQVFRRPKRFGFLLDKPSDFNEMLQLLVLSRFSPFLNAAYGTGKFCQDSHLFGMLRKVQAGVIYPDPNWLWKF